MALPRSVAGECRAEDVAVAVPRQCGEAPTLLPLGLGNPPWRPKPIVWTEIAAKTYETPHGGPDHYVAIGPMNPAEQRYAEMRVVLRGQPEAWVYAAADIRL